MIFQWYSYAYIYTVPTEKGKKNIDIYSPFYFVKRIERREVDKFTDETWLVAQQQEKEGNIEI